MTNNRPQGRIDRGTRDKIRREILRNHGLIEVRRGGKLVIEDRPHLPVVGFSKTPLMRQIEMRFGQDIKDLLCGDTEDAIAERLGIKQTTVSHWRLRLGLRQNKNGRTSKPRSLPEQQAGDAKGGNR